MSGVPRWWQSGECSIDIEREHFASAEVAFSLDQPLLDRMDVVVFRGHLRFGARRCAAYVEYPPGYASGCQPEVFAPALNLPRHMRSDGLLCLDHRVLGERAPMTGAEAVQRAELLWRLSIEDPEALSKIEADGPEPAIETYLFEPGSAAYLFGIDATGHQEGWMRLAARCPDPFRGALSGMGTSRPADGALAVDSANTIFQGPASVCGFWRRISAPPVSPISAWLRNHEDLVQRALGFAAAHSEITRTTQPALVAFVFPDEGPKRNEYHDEWLLILINLDDTAVRLPRPVVVQSHDEFIRQPQLAQLTRKRVAIIGVGALGSQIAALLARAGVGAFCLVDRDIVSAGILVRHQLDYDSVGVAKATAVGGHLLKINPNIVVHSWVHGFGLAGCDAQHQDDKIVGELSSCDLIINATANSDSGFYISSIADVLQRPALHVAVSSGAWGGRVLIQRHGQSGCLECQGRHQESANTGGDVVPAWSEDPEFPEALDRGCAQATFTGPGFDITTTAAAATRAAVAQLLIGEGYPGSDCDLITLHLRDAATARLAASYDAIPRHPACTSCHA